MIPTEIYIGIMGGFAGGIAIGIFLTLWSLRKKKK